MQVSTPNFQHEATFLTPCNPLQSSCSGRECCAVQTGFDLLGGGGEGSAPPPPPPQTLQLPSLINVKDYLNKNTVLGMIFPLALETILKALNPTFFLRRMSLTQPRQCYIKLPPQTQNPRWNPGKRGEWTE